MIYCVCHRLPAPSDTFPGTSNFHRSVATGRLPAQCVPAPFPKTRNGRSGPILFGNPTPSSQSLDVMACFFFKLQDTDDFIQVSWLGPLTPDSYAQLIGPLTPDSDAQSFREPARHLASNHPFPRFCPTSFHHCIPCSLCSMARTGRGGRTGHGPCGRSMA